MMMTKRAPRTLGATRLDRLLAARGIKRTRFAEETGYSKQYVQRVRFGDSELTAKAIRCFVKAARTLANDPSITANDLFPLDDDDSPQ